jgi:hypothetical protein
MPLDTDAEFAWRIVIDYIEKVEMLSKGIRFYFRWHGIKLPPIPRFTSGMPLYIDICQTFIFLSSFYTVYRHVLGAQNVIILESFTAWTSEFPSIPGYHAVLDLLYIFYIQPQIPNYDT